MLASLFWNYSSRIMRKTDEGDGGKANAHSVEKAMEKEECDGVSGGRCPVVNVWATEDDEESQKWED